MSWGCECKGSNGVNSGLSSHEMTADITTDIIGSSTKFYNTGAIDQ